ncbi:MAG: hypothetical protein JW783_00360 [Bacteroidales bacterium]|nr:hypothetical protein [Bacteroidales bacterium]MBN2748473.1 hypothetical protein [Bacteroidales bacterium]
MTDIISTVIISLLTGLAGGFSGWFFSRKRQNIENIDLALTTWQKVVDSLENRVTVLLSKVDALTAENYQLREELERLKIEMQAKLRENKKIEQLEKKVQKYEKLLTDNNIEF